jgi:hypothetical protein
MTVPTKPRIQVRQATVADVPTMVDIHYAAFGLDVMDKLMHPNGVTEDIKTKFGSTFFPAADPAKPKKKGETIIMVAELVPEEADSVAAPEIMAFSKWVLQREPRTEEEWNVEEPPMTVEQLGEGSDVDVFNAFIGGLHRKRRLWAKGDPCLCESKCHPTTPRESDQHTGS